MDLDGTLVTLLTLLLVTWCEADLQVRGPHHPKSERATGDHHHHKHYHPKQGEDGQQPGKLTQDNHLLHDEEHIKEDLEGQVSQDDLDNMSPQELEFHYFKIHDMDNNTKLDGLEMLHAILHVAPSNTDGKDDEEAKKQSEEDFQYYIAVIDRVLEEDDLDHDGYLNYPEYVAAKNKKESEEVTREEVAAQVTS